MYYIYKRTTEKNLDIEYYHHEEQALARMEYLAIHNTDPNTTGFYVESSDMRLIAEYEV